MSTVEGWFNTPAEELGNTIENQRLSHELLEAEGKLPRDIYPTYDLRAEDPKIVMTMRNYLQKMEQYTLVTSEGSTGFREYLVTGEIH